MPDAPYLVTGAAGFIGARFVEACGSRRRPTISVDRLESFAERTEHGGLDFGEIVDREQLFDWLTTAPPLAGIVHLGACTDTTLHDIAYFERVNVEYSRRLWIWASEHQVPFVYASSGATYGGGEHGYDDDESRIPELKPLNPYGDSKQIFDLWALEEERQGRSPPSWAGFKFFNVYGFGERHKGPMSSVVVQAFDQILERQRVRLFRSDRPDIEDGHQSRDFVSVEDVVNVLQFALEKPLPRGIFNLGTGKARTFLDLVRATFAALDMPCRLDWIDTPEHLRGRYQYFTEAPMGRLREAGWDRDFLSLEEGVRRYVTRLQSSREQNA